MVPDDVNIPLNDAKAAAERHAATERFNEQFEHAYQWLALAHEIQGILLRLHQRSEYLKNARSKDSGGVGRVFPKPPGDDDMFSGYI